jgi:hypothetical protein
VAYTFHKVKKTENKSSDRTFSLRVIDGKKPISSVGLVDTRLFTGENKLHAIQENGLWYLKYEQGGLQSALKQKWVSFNSMLNDVKTFYARRNIEVKEII